jgi:hypothetical protein
MENPEFEKHGDRWHHIKIDKKPHEAKFYLDGCLANDLICATTGKMVWVEEKKNPCGCESCTEWVRRHAEPRQL